MTSFSEQVKQIAEQFVVVAEAQRLIQEAEEGYLGYYQNSIKPGETQPDDMPYKPEEVQMQFWRQMLYLAGPSIDYPCIITCMNMFVAGAYFGEYTLFSFVDGTPNDDVMIWNLYPLKALPYRSDRADWPEYPVDEFESVPEPLRAFFPTLNALAESQKLKQQAEQRCRQWFREHPNWDHNYPQSLHEIPNPREDWFREHPDWFRLYPKRPFPPKRHTVTIGFNRLFFCFQHGQYPEPHFLTKLRIFAGKYEIGEYTLATNAEGEVIEELSGIRPYTLYLYFY